MSVEFVTKEVLFAIMALGILAVVAEGLVEYLIEPIWKRFGLDTFWLRYWAWAVAAILVILAGNRANAFSTLLPYSWAGLILSAVIAGRGSSWLHQIFAGKTPTEQDQPGKYGDKD